MSFEELDVNEIVFRATVLIVVPRCTFGIPMSGMFFFLLFYDGPNCYFTVPNIPKFTHGTGILVRRGAKLVVYTSHSLLCIIAEGEGFRDDGEIQHRYRDDEIHVYHHGVRIAAQFRAAGCDPFDLDRVWVVVVYFFLPLLTY